MSVLQLLKVVLVLTVFMPGETLASCACADKRNCSWRKYDSAWDAYKVCMRNCPENYISHCIYQPDSIRVGLHYPFCKCVAISDVNNGNLGNNGSNGNNGD